MFHRNENSKSFNFLYILYVKLKNKIHGKIDDFSLGLRNLHEYLDITTLIKRLQDLDKLKAILLSEHQKVLFECIPKPAILGRSRNNSKVLTLENLVPKKTKQKFEIMLSSRRIPITNDNVTLKIIEILDPKTRNNLIEGFYLTKLTTLFLYE